MNTPPIEGTHLQNASSPLTGKSVHTAAPNILPAPGGSMGTPASISGDRAQSPGTRKV